MEAQAQVARGCIGTMLAVVVVVVVVVVEAVVVVVVAAGWEGEGPAGACRMRCPRRRLLNWKKGIVNKQLMIRFQSVLPGAQDENKCI